MREEMGKVGGIESVGRKQRRHGPKFHRLSKFLQKACLTLTVEHWLGWGSSSTSHRLITSFTSPLAEHSNDSLFLFFFFFS